MTDDVDRAFDLLNDLPLLAKACHEQACKSGFYEDDAAIAECLEAFPAPAISESGHKIVARWLAAHVVNMAIKRHGLINTEIAEMTEAVRKPSFAHHISMYPSTHVEEAPVPRPADDFTQEEEEAADVLIRLMDYCGWRNLRIGPATQEKMIYNSTRSHMHGGKLA